MHNVSITILIIMLFEFFTLLVIIIKIFKFTLCELLFRQE